ncbi:unnamed protein product [Allacma fusca]|uniref:Uncharacterized protein n=1 Tax=Allacma fusca TaxID=39272 RepID=A0A8J2P4K4_9HEXA|nr:unnamed protein product [Allacma fusca]
MTTKQIEEEMMAQNTNSFVAMTGTYDMQAQCQGSENPRRIIEFEVPAFGFINNQNHTCLEPHFMTDHPGCFKCRGEDVNHSSSHCPEYPMGIEEVPTP